MCNKVNSGPLCDDCRLREEGVTPAQLRKESGPLVRNPHFVAKKKRSRESVEVIGDMSKRSRVGSVRIVIESSMGDIVESVRTAEFHVE